MPVARVDLSCCWVFGTGLFTDCSLRHQRSGLASVSLSADRQALMLTSMGWEELITVTPGVRSGKPCVRGTRITVQDVLEYLAAGMTEAQILTDFPSLTSESIRKPCWRLLPPVSAGWRPPPPDLSECASASTRT